MSNLRKKLNEIEQGVDEAAKAVNPMTKVKRSEVIVFKSVELLRELVDLVEAMEQAHGWHLSGGNEDGK